MESEIYASSIGSTTAPSSNAIAIPIVSSSTSRRHHQTKKRSHDVNSTENLDERIEVKILPQDDNWGETTTITCHGGNEDTMTNTNETTLQLNENPTNSDQCQRPSKRFSREKSALSLSNFLIYLICFIAFISPIFFLVLPHLLLNPSEKISIDDFSPILTLIFKEILLLIGTLALLYRRRNHSFLPRIHLQKLVLMIILTLIIGTFWSFYIWTIFRLDVEKFDEILSLTSMYEDLLLFLLIISVLIIEIKWFYPRWIVKVVRSPDGQTRQYTIGSVSIQEAAIYLLEQYYKDFPVFNPWLENAQQTQAKRSGPFSTKSVGSQSNASTENGTLGRSMRGFNDRSVEMKTKRKWEEI